MKKYLCLWLSGVLLASLCGCNNALDVSDDNSGATTTDSMAKVQYQALLENVYQEQSDTYYTLYDVDGDDTQELLVKVGETIVINTARNDWTLPDESDIDWVSFEEEPVHMVDMTFDGFQDVAVCVDNVYGKIFAVLRWDTKLEKLVMMPTTLQNPAVDSQNAIIRTSRSGDQIVSYSMWSYDEEQKDFVRTHSLYFHQNEQATGDDDNMKLVVRENGDEKILYVRGEPYALDKTDPQVAPYYDLNSVWKLGYTVWDNDIYKDVVHLELLQSAYDALLSYHYSNPTRYRYPGVLQPETSEIITLNGQQYQSYVASNVDIRYVFVSNDEYDMNASWDWIAVGTRYDYSWDNLGKIDVGQRGDEPDDSIWYSEEVGVRGRIWLGMTEQELYDVLNEHNIEITFANFTYERDAYGAEYLPSSDFYYKRLYTKGHQYFYFDEDNRLAEIHYSDQLRPSMDPVNEEFEAQHGVRRGGTYEEMIAAYGEPDQVIEQEGNQSCVYHLENGDYLHFVYQGLSLPILFITYSRHPIPYSIW